MSTHSTREGALAQTPSRIGILGKRMLLWLLVVLLLTAFEVGIRHVPPDAVQVTTTSAESGRTLSTQEITSARTVAEFYARLNSLPLDRGYVDPKTCPLRYLPTLESYTVRFTRWARLSWSPSGIAFSASLLGSSAAAVFLGRGSLTMTAMVQVFSLDRR